MYSSHLNPSVTLIAHPSTAMLFQYMSSSSQSILTSSYSTITPIPTCLDPQGYFYTILLYDILKLKTQFRKPFRDPYFNNPFAHIYSAADECITSLFRVVLNNLVKKSTTVSPSVSTALASFYSSSPLVFDADLSCITLSVLTLSCSFCSFHSSIL